MLPVAAEIVASQRPQQMQQWLVLPPLEQAAVLPGVDAADQDMEAAFGTPKPKPAAPDNAAGKGFELIDVGQPTDNTSSVPETTGAMQDAVTAVIQNMPKNNIQSAW